MVRKRAKSTATRKNHANTVALAADSSNTPSNLPSPGHESPHTKQYTTIHASGRRKKVIRAHSRLEEKTLSRWCDCGVRTVRRHALVDWRDAAYGDDLIQGGYRTASSCWEAFLSLWTCHNEFMNIWTHMIGVVVFVYLVIMLFPASGLQDPSFELSGLLRSTYATQLPAWNRTQEVLSKLQYRVEEVGGAMRGEVDEVLASARHHLSLLEGRVHLLEEEAAERVRWWIGSAHRTVDALLQDRLPEFAHGFTKVPDPSEPIPTWPMLAFLLSAITCLSASVSFHWFGIVSEYWYKMLARADYGAIAILIFGSQMPPIHYAFFCQPFFKWLYTLLALLTCGAAAIAALSDAMSQPEWRALRAGVYVLTGVTGGIAMLHIALDPEFNQYEDVVRALWHLIAMGILYISGAALYAFRIPERFFPGAFDTLLASHQIFHVEIIAAALVHYQACILFLQWRSAHPLCT